MDGGISDRFLKIDEVVDRTSISRATIYRLMDSGEFPRRIALSKGCVRWSSFEVSDWMQSKLASRTIQ